MVYISLDEEGRTKGKAAIDVVGSQAGKSGGSMLQQLLLVLHGGAISGSLPIMFIVYLVMSGGWLRSVNQLSDFNPRRVRIRESVGAGVRGSVGQRQGEGGKVEEEKNVECRGSHCENASRLIVRVLACLQVRAPGERALVFDQFG
jgi:hypothetical protein